MTRQRRSRERDRREGSCECSQEQKKGKESGRRPVEKEERRRGQILQVFLRLEARRSQGRSEANLWHGAAYCAFKSVQNTRTHPDKEESKKKKRLVLQRNERTKHRPHLCASTSLLHLISFPQSLPACNARQQQETYQKEEFYELASKESSGVFSCRILQHLYRCLSRLNRMQKPLRVYCETLEQTVTYGVSQRARLLLAAHSWPLLPVHKDRRTGSVGYAEDLHVDPPD